MITLMKHQRANGARMAQIAAGYGASGDFSPTGTGKTFSALEACRIAEARKVLVICPKAVIFAWKRAAADFFGPEFPPINVINYESAIRRKWHELFDGIDAVIFDEAHRCKGLRTKNSELLIHAARLENVPVFCLSATAARDPLGMKALGYALGLHHLSDFYDFCRSYGCEQVRQVVHGGRKRLVWKFRGSREDLLRLNKVIFQQHAVFTPTSAIPEFPDAVEQVIDVDIDADRYRGALGAFGDLSGEPPGVVRLREQQAVEAGKVPFILERVQDELEEGQSVVVFCTFRDTLEDLREGLVEHNPGIIWGDQSANQRQEFIDAFQRNEIHVMLVQAQAGGTGLSLHDLHGRPRTALLCPTEHVEQLVQCLGRIHRSGAVSKAVQQILVAPGTIEDAVAANMRRKLGHLNTLTRNDWFADGGTTVEETQAPKPKSDEKTYVPRPSSAPYLFLCPSWRSDDKGSDNAATQRGSYFHYCIERELATEDVDMPHWEDAHDKDRKDVEEKAGMCVEWLRWEIESNWPECEYAVEKRMKPVPGWKGGMADVLLMDRSKRAIGVVDWKSNRHSPVKPAKTNKQGLNYAIAASIEFPWAEFFTVYFVQPWVDIIDQHTFTREEIFEYQRQFTTLAALTNDPDRPEKPSPYACQYCVRKPECKAIGARAVETVNALTVLEPSSFDLPANLNPEEIVTAQNAALAFKAAKILEDWAKAVKTKVKEFSDEGIELPGLTVGTRRSPLKVIDPSAAAAVVTNMFDFSEEELMMCASLSLPKLKEIVGSKAPRGQKGKKQGELVARLEDEGILSGGQETTYLKIEK
jgi:hypothetical protein